MQKKWIISIFLLLLSVFCIRAYSLDINVDSEKKQNTWYEGEIKGKFLINSGAPGYTYSWKEGGYGECDKTCGGGDKTQTVVCQRNDGQEVADTFCTAPKPAETMECNIQVCPSFTYSWKTGNFSTCTRTCGGGTQTRTVQCQRSDGQYMKDESLCTEPKPTDSQSCNTQCCNEELYYYDQYDPGTPPVGYACTGFVNFKARSYVRGGTKEIGDWGYRRTGTNCGVSTPMLSCAYSDADYKWDTSDWTSCSNTCGKGTQTRTVKCLKNGNEYVDEGFCNDRQHKIGNKPATTQECNFYQKGCVNGSCGTSTNTCTKGTIFRDIADTTMYLKWQCDGINGGNPKQCQKEIGRCGSSANICSYGGLWIDHVSTANSSNYIWVCGWGDGTNVSCSLPK